MSKIQARTLSRLGIIVFLTVLGSAGSSTATQEISWTTRSPMPTPRLYAGAVVVQEQIYVIGGFSGSTLGTVEAYDPATDTWTTRASMPTARAIPVVVSVDDKIYAIGGFQFEGLTDGTHTVVTEEYDPVTDTWTPRADLPAPIEGTRFLGNASIGGAALKGQIYVSVFSPNLSPEGPTATYRYDPSTDEWQSTAAPIPFTYTRFSVDAIGDRLYALSVGEAPYGGSFDIGAPLAEYDGETDIWILRPATPSARRAMGVAAATGRLYAVGGLVTERTEPEQTFYRRVADVEFYDPVENRWLEATPMEVPRHSPAVVEVNERLYVIGGGVTPSNNLFASPTIPLDIVEEGSFPAPAVCEPDELTLCLDDRPGDRRYAVRLDFETVQGGGKSGGGQAVTLSSLGVSRGGLFWFFNKSNPEMLIKVLDGCPINQHHWVFYSAGTNVGFTVTVHDTATDAVWSSTNPDLRAAPSVQDTEALPCP